MGAWALGFPSEAALKFYSPHTEGPEMEWTFLRVCLRLLLMLVKSQVSAAALHPGLLTPVYSTVTANKSRKEGGSQRGPRERTLPGAGLPVSRPPPSSAPLPSCP